MNKVAAAKKRPSAKTLRVLLTYDPMTGRFNWRRTLSNQVEAGAQAGWIEAKGYRRICIGGIGYQAHRLAWLYMTGEWPSEQIDHINLDKADNRWGNLREATNSQNQSNVGPRRQNTSGRKGVYWHKRLRKWQVSIMINRHLHFLGYRDSREDAAALYAAATQHFGQFARVA